MENNQKRSKFLFNLKSIISQFKHKKEILFYVFLGFCLLMIFLPLDDTFTSKISLVASIVSLIVACIALRLQRKSDKDLNRIETAVKELQTTGQQIKEDTKRIEDISLNMQTTVNKALFQIERTNALNKHPESERFKKINEAYQPFIFCLFDEIKYNIKIQINSKEFYYKIQIIKDEITNIPKKVKALGIFDFYIIQIIGPSYPSSLNQDKTLKQQYEKNPIQEGGYYCCRFDEGQCSWTLSQKLALGSEKEGFFFFQPHSNIPSWKPVKIL